MNRQSKGKNRKFKMIVGIFFVSLFALVSYAYIQFDTSRDLSIQEIQQVNDTKENVNEPKKIEKKEPIEFQADKTVKNKPIHVLLVGVDSDDGVHSRTDTIMIAQYAPKNGTLKLASIMRDSYVDIPGYANNKINTSFFLGGLELLRQTIKENFEIDLHYYAMVNFEGFVKIVDIIAPNGIEVEIEEDMVYQMGDVNINFQPGPKMLDGKEALNYVRFRNQTESDFGRVRRQQNLLNQLKNEILTLRGMTRVPQVIGAIDPYIDTNISTTKTLAYAKDLLIKPVDEIETLTIPVNDGFENKYYRHAGAVLELDLNANKEALHKFFELSNEEDVE